MKVKAQGRKVNAWLTLFGLFAGFDVPRALGTEGGRILQRP
jgi:hypothetical protein